MKRFFKFFLRLLLLLIIAFFVFFFWASSSTLPESDYAKLIENQYETIAENDSVFSIVTYNIGYLSGMTNNRAVDKSKALFDQNLEKVVSETKAINPDIIAFQEIDYDASRSFNINQQNEIAKLGYNFVAEAVNWDKTYLPFPYWPPSSHFGKVVSGQSIISKYPLKEHRRIVLERVPNSPFHREAFYIDRLAQVVKVTLQGTEVVLINVHLEAFDAPTRARQFEEIILLFNTYKEKYPTILLGDFNSEARDKDAVIHTMFQMNDIGNAAFSKDDIQNTFDSEQPSKRIDYIFYTKNTIEYVGGKVLTQFEQSSDHLPVEMRFKLK